MNFNYTNMTELFKHDNRTISGALQTNFKSLSDMYLDYIFMYKISIHLYGRCPFITFITG